MAVESLNRSENLSGGEMPELMESVFNAIVTQTHRKSSEGEGQTDKEYRTATDNEAWPPVLGTNVEQAPASEGSDALLYTTADGEKVLVKADINPKLHDYLTKLKDLAGSPETVEYLEGQAELHDARILRGDDALPELKDIQGIEVWNDGMLVMLKDGTNVTLTKQLTPDAFAAGEDLMKTLEGIKKSEDEGYERVSDNPFTNDQIEGATIGWEGEAGPGLVRAEIFDGEGGSRKVIVSKEDNPELYERLVSTDESRRYDDKSIDEAREEADLPPTGDFDVLQMETTESDPKDKNKKLTVSELTWQNLIADWKKGIEDGSIKPDDDRAKLYDTLRAKGALENGLDMTVLDMSLGQNVEKVSGEDIGGIIDEVKLDEKLAELFSSEAVLTDFQRIQSLALCKLENKDEIQSKLEEMAFGEDYAKYIADLKEQGKDALAEADIGNTFAALSALDPEKGAQFAQSMQLNATTIDLDKLLANPDAISDENTATASQDVMKTLLTALKKGGVDLPRRTVEMERFIQEFLGDKQNAKTFGKALTELGAMYQQNGSLSQADVDKVMSKEAYKTIGEGAHGSMLKAVSEMNANGLLGSTGGLISLASGIYQLAGKGGSLADTPEERLAIAKEFVSVLGAGQHFVNLGTNIYDRVNGTDINKMMGLDKSLPEIFGKDEPTRGGPISLDAFNKLGDNFSLIVDQAPTTGRDKPLLTGKDYQEFLKGYEEGFAKNPGLSGSTPGTRALSSFLRIMDAGANVFGGVADLVLGGLKIKSASAAGDKVGIAQGSITVAAGAFTLAGGGAQMGALAGVSAARAFAAPLLWVGAALTVALTPFLIVEDIKHNNRMDKNRDDIKDLFSSLDQQGLLVEDGAKRFEFLDEYMYSYGQRDAPEDVSIFEYRKEEYEFYAEEGHLPEEGWDDLEHKDYDGDGDNLDTRLDS